MTSRADAGPSAARLQSHDATLARYAARDALSRGRQHPEPEDKYRGEFQRDRDRVIHSGAFRRLEYKTQVFVNHEGDMFRTRLTHSIEVGQLSRTVARSLQLNEDLTEAIALAHDLGHTPFGHAGQDALNACMREFGGFEHNLQSLRIVDTLEERYPGFDGLNLTFETREGVLKHCAKSNARLLGDIGERFLNGGQPSLEAQVANVADEVAYNHHDADDGLRSGLISVADLKAVTTFRECAESVTAEWPDLSQRRTVHEIVRRMINEAVIDLLSHTEMRIAESRVTSIDDVRRAPHPLVELSARGRKRHLELKRFLHQRLYRHYRVHRMTVKAKRTVECLFQAFLADPRLLPHDVQDRLAEQHEHDGDRRRARAIADYIAGMTDRYAIAEYQRIFDPQSLT